MNKTNFHTHCDFCDGAFPAREMAESAFQRGFSAFGFSSHAPLPGEVGWHMRAEALPSYVKEIRRLGRLYSGRMEIALGLERDYLPGTHGAFSKDLPGAKLDFSLGSVHYLDPEKSGAPASMFTVDAPLEEFSSRLGASYGGDIRSLVRDYYSAVRAMVGEGGFDIVGHLDLVKRNNGSSRFFDEKEAWYRDEVLETVESIKGRELIVEVNTGGMARGYTQSPYPSLFALQEMRLRGIMVTICSDAHDKEKVDAFFPEAREILLEAGYRETAALSEGRWIEIPI